MSLGLKFIVECFRNLVFDCAWRQVPNYKADRYGCIREGRYVWIRGTAASTGELLQPACDRRVAAFPAFSFSLWPECGVVK